MSKNWKDALLSSGLPLEYDVNGILLKSGFHVRGEQPYSRRTGTSAEEFSVDLHAHHYVEEAAKEGSFKAELVTICECKYRTPNKHWLFMPDLNDGDFSPSWPGAFRFFSAFTTYSFDEMPLKSFCYDFPSVMKGVELHANGAECYDKDIRHALNQLRYAMPEVILHYLHPLAYSHPNDCKPFFILPLLVTNAPLRILKEQINLDAVRTAQDLDEISQPVDFVDVHSPHADDFRSHCQKVFSDAGPRLAKGGKHHVFQKLEEHHRKQGRLLSPVSDLIGLELGSGPEPGCFTQFLVVNLSALSSLLEKAKGAVSAALRDSKQIVFAESEVST